MILFLLHLAGAAALLLWAVRLIRTGVERAFMAQMRLVLRRSRGRRAVAALSGAGAAMLLQSSTAVALIVTGFMVSGGMAAATGLALILGADLGSAIAVQILLARVDWLVPLLLVVGAGIFLRGRIRKTRQVGRILVGLALVFVSLEMIRQTTAPLQDSRAVGILVGYLGDDLLSAFVIGAVLAYAVHSSVAAVLMFVTFVAGGLLPVAVGAALVLGANLGGAVIPVVLNLSAPAAGRRVVFANLFIRGGSAFLALAVLALGNPPLGLLGTAPHTQVVNLHLLFNLAVVVLGVPLAGLAARAGAMLLPDRDDRHVDAGPPTALDNAALGEPERALGCASREAMNMGQQVAAMLAPVLQLFRHWDDGTASMIRNAEDRVDRMHFEIKMFIAQIQESPLTSAQSQQAMDLATYSNNLEDAGDHISTNLVDIARRMKSRGLSFSDDGWRDLEDFHDRVTSNVQLALNVMMSGESEVARQLLEEKDRVRDYEQVLQARHLERLRLGTTESIDTSNLHQEALRSLKQVNTALSSVAYPIAEEAGDLMPTRLADNPGGDDMASNGGETSARARE